MSRNTPSHYRPTPGRHFRTNAAQLPGAQVNDLVPEGHAAPKTLPAAAASKHAERQVLDGKIRLPAIGAVEPAFQRRIMSGIQMIHAVDARQRARLSK
jgi:hypothetical protein